jgi:diguanylate cyclase (GGDEF)-like protein
MKPPPKPTKKPKTASSEVLWQFDFEESLNRFASWLDAGDRPAEIDQDLLALLGRWLPASRSELIRRLNTMSALAACALESLRSGSEWPGDRAPRSLVKPFAESHPTTGDVPSDCGGHYPQVVHDATFLNAVLPYAISQAQRHREPLSLVCIAIDRLHGIQEVLGRGVADSLVRGVGEMVVSLIRTSDIVARLDDDRVVAVLPRSDDDSALKIAEMICQNVATRRWSVSDQPGMKITVSVGAATYPTSADNVFALFEAADDALACAQARGRNQAVAAPHNRNSPQNEAVAANGAS